MYTPGEFEGKEHAYAISSSTKASSAVHTMVSWSGGTLFSNASFRKIQKYGGLGLFSP